MQDMPKPVPGPDLAEQRRTLGVTQIRLAEHLGLHRLTLNGWEKAATVDPIRVARYQRALREVVTEEIGQSA